MAIDTAWFKDTIASSQYGSLRRLAVEMQWDVATLSRMLSGERGMSIEDARLIADLLMVPMGEVIRRAGVPFGVRDNVAKR